MVQAAFDKLLGTIGLSASQKSQGSTSHQYVRGLLDKKWQSDSSFPWLVEGDFLSGSYARGTKIHPLNDIDVMVVLDGTGLTAFDKGQTLNAEVRGAGTAGSPVNSYTYNQFGHISSKMVLEKFHDALKETYPNSEIKKHGQAVNVWLDSYQLGLDIVPCFHIMPRDGRRDFYYIPAGGDQHTWLSTNPKIDKEIVDAMDTFHDGKFKPVVRLLKHWNEVHNASRLESYHIETVAVYALGWEQKITDHADGVRRFFSNAGIHLQNPCPDMTQLGGPVDTYLSQEARQATVQKLREALQHLTTPPSAGLITLPAHQLGGWRKIYGVSFGV